VHFGYSPTVIAIVDRMCFELMHELSTALIGLVEATKVMMDYLDVISRHQGVYSTSF
jgi:hypothetical protein